MDTNARIFVTNLGKYNEGELIGEWLKLPFTDDELKNLLNRIGISNKPDEHGRYYEEIFITDYESDIQSLKISEYTNINHLNDLFENIEELSDDDFLAFQALIKNGNEIEEALETAEEGKYCIYNDCKDMLDVAYAVVEKTGLLENVSDVVKRNFNYASYIDELESENVYVPIFDSYIEFYT